MNKLRWLALGLGLAGLGAAAWVAAQAHRALHPLVLPAGAQVERLARTADLQDLGVTDVDGDGQLDVYSLNHSNRQLLLLRTAEGGYRDQLVELGLSQSAEFPGVEEGAAPPDMPTPGLYVFWHHGRLRLVGTAPCSATGLLRLPRKLKVSAQGGASLESMGENQYRFAFRAGGEIEIASWKYYFVPVLELDPAADLAQVFVGPHRIRPTSHRFSLPEQDRHGMAWADHNLDGVSDVFIVRGGDEGRLGATYPDARDEWLVSSSGRYQDQTAGSGLEKNGMPGRCVQWVDVDGDGHLDLFVVNGREAPPNQDAPNQVFLQVAPGRFREAAAELGLDLPGQGRSLWLDVDQDGDADLVWASGKALQLLVNFGGSFSTVDLLSLPREPSQLTAGDFNRDGATDVFVASKQGNHLLLGRDQTLAPRDPGALGLPGASFTANWVDHDNDGRLDLHVLPQGLYRQQEDGNFARTGLLAMKDSALLSDRRVCCTWFDADNDGQRDLLVSLPDPVSSVRSWVTDTLQRRPLFRPREWDVRLYTLPGTTANHWFQVRLEGPAGNAPGIGARVEVETARQRTVARVGEAEGATRSQGHYRLYFGLGEEQRVTRLLVTWPDGLRQEVSDVAADQLVVLAHPSRLPPPTTNRAAGRVEKIAAAGGYSPIRSGTE